MPDELGFSRGFDKNNRVDPFVNDNKFNELLEELENNRDENFFLFLHTWKVHAPYSNSYFFHREKINKEKRNYIDNFEKLSKKAIDKVASFRKFLKENALFNVNDCVTLYDSCIFYVDQYIGEIINKTKKLGIYDDLLFIIVSDHGEHFEEHYLNKFYDYHGEDYYEEFIKVPLIVKYPHSLGPRIVNYPVSLIDVFPTILDYYKIKIPDFVQGKSLLHSEYKSNIRYLISEAVSMSGIERKMIRVGDLKYIITMQNPSKAERVNWNSITERRLFDLKNDPLEQNNLYKDLKYRKICNNLEKVLKKIIKSSAGTNRPVKKTKLNKKTIEHLKSLGYLK